MAYQEQNCPKQVMRLITKASKLKTESKIKYLQPCSSGFISYYDTEEFKLRVYDPQQQVQISQFRQHMWTKDCHPYYIGQNTQWLYKPCDGINQTYLIKNDIQEMKFHWDAFLAILENIRYSMKDQTRGPPMNTQAPRFLKKIQMGQ